MKRKINENVFIFVVEGTLYINSNNRKYEISKNQFIFLRKNEEHYGFKESSETLKYYWVHFSDEMEIQTENTLNPNYIFPEYGSIEDSTRLLILFNQMMDYSLEKNLFNKNILNYSLSIFFMELSQKYIETITNSSNTINSVINDIQNWIKLNFQKDFSLDELSQNLNLQANYISKLFKQSTGMTILQYVTDLRITAAKKFLQIYSIKETAYSCGFSDEKYFMKVFKKIEGITPSQYKKAFSLKYINQ